MTCTIISCSNNNNTPNILFVVMDDVGIDQMSVFGHGGIIAPSMPNINAVAAAGVRFRNSWSMPECSPGRAAFFTGRYPFRTNVYQAIGQNDLQNSQLSPYDMTTPKLLQKANYVSAMIGKFHLAGPENNRALEGTPLQLGWDYFNGWIGGLPASIDTTAGGVGAEGTYSCGFVPDLAHGGADTGACYQPDGSCGFITGTSTSGDVAGKQCLMSGGILVPRTACESTVPSSLNFDKQNAYYVSPLVINNSDGIQSFALTNSKSRGYRTTIETDAAISWINSQSNSAPWMTSVTYSAAHTPLQQPPASLTPSTPLSGDGLDCSVLAEKRVLQNQMTEAMDTEIGRLLVETSLATRNSDGTLNYDPNKSNTMIIILGDNGTYGPSVKTPFNPTLAKGTAYQSGVWVPLIVAGPLVVAPNREVTHMVNMVDVYQLFGEIAKINVVEAVPRTIDSAPMMPYLADKNSPSAREMNFTMGGFNIQANGGRNAPCVFSATSCSQIPLSSSVCSDNGGVWWGPGYTDSSVITPPIGPESSQGYQQCWQVNQAKHKSSQDLIKINPGISTAIRNDNYKLIQNTIEAYVSETDSHTTIVTNEFYLIDEDPTSLAIDNPGSQNQLNPASSEFLTTVYNNLSTQLNTVLASNPACPGDGNIDGFVNALDFSLLQESILNWGLSSTYDFNFDGLTNNSDQTFVQNFSTCLETSSVY